MKFLNKALFIPVFLVALSSCGGDDGDDYTSVLDIIEDSDAHATLTTAIIAAGLDGTLDDKTAEFTVFAPTDAAFEAVGTDALNALLADTDQLYEVLLYHVLNYEATASDILGSNSPTLAMINGDEVAKGFEGSDLYLNFALVVDTDLSADNGVVHVIDAVLLPLDLTPGTSDIVQTAVDDGRFTTLVAALQQTGLDATLADENTNFTVFAPTDDAFAMLPAGTITALLNDTDTLSDLLLQHVISGAAVDSVTALTLDGSDAETASGASVSIDVDFSAEILSVGGANVIISDIVTSNGIIHAIDAVIVGDVDVPQPSLVDVATESGFNSLVAALEATSLDVVLADLDESYTVFAPTDAAFEALGQDTLDALFDDPDTLSDILLYHVIPDATILSTAAVGVANADDSKVATVNGGQLGLSFVSDTLFINTSTVTDADLMASNGVIHQIDQVLTPPAAAGTPTSNIVQTAIAAGDFDTLVLALQTAGLDTVLSDDSQTFTVFAPTDAAFDLIPSETLSALLADVPALEQVLLQHVISGAAVDSVTAFTLNGTSVDTAATADNSDVTIEIVDGVLEVQGSAVSTYDIYTTNGVIHVIDAVITETLE